MKYYPLNTYYTNVLCRKTDSSVLLSESQVNWAFLTSYNGKLLIYRVRRRIPMNLQIEAAVIYRFYSTENIKIVDNNAYFISCAYVHPGVLEITTNSNGRLFFVVIECDFVRISAESAERILEYYVKEKREDQDYEHYRELIRSLKKPYAQD